MDDLIEVKTLNSIVINSATTGGFYLGAAVASCFVIPGIIYRLIYPIRISDLPPFGKTNLHQIKLVQNNATIDIYPDNPSGRTKAQREASLFLFLLRRTIAVGLVGSYGALIGYSVSRIFPNARLTSLLIA